jgi:hypothetical protein
MRVSRLLFIFLLLGAPLARGDPLQHEFLVLPSAQVVGTFDRQSSVTQPYDEVVQADALLTLQKGPFRLFGEYLLSDHEGDLERFQLGWQLSSDTIIWVGRYHQPTSVWNHDHHHGQYLQTSITRPAIDEWEDLRGVLPQHFTGVLVESTHEAFGDWRLRTSMASGIAPKITAAGFEPFDLVHPDSTHRLGYQARASLHPGEFTETGAGALVAYDQLAAEMRPGAHPPLIGLNYIDLRLYGLFGTYAGEGWKLTATVYFAHTELHYIGSAASDSFGVGYVQAERHFGRDFTGFVRYEESAGVGDCPYLRLFEQFARKRYVGGLRWDFTDRQALTLQLTDSFFLNGHFSDARLQWSAALF